MGKFLLSLSLLILCTSEAHAQISITVADNAGTTNAGSALTVSSASFSAATNDLILVAVATSGTPGDADTINWGSSGSSQGTCVQGKTIASPTYKLCGWSLTGFSGTATVNFVSGGTAKTSLAWTVWKISNWDTTVGTWKQVVTCAKDGNIGADNAHCGIVTGTTQITLAALFNSNSAVLAAMTNSDNTEICKASPTYTCNAQLSIVTPTNQFRSEHGVGSANSDTTPNFTSSTTNGALGIAFEVSALASNCPGWLLGLVCEEDHFNNSSYRF
jgi:hypothetical protein